MVNAIKQLREQQRKLQASSTRIEEMLKQLTENQPECGQSSIRQSIPRALSVSFIYMPRAVMTSRFDSVYLNRGLCMMCMMDCLMPKKN